MKTVLTTFGVQEKEIKKGLSFSKIFSDKGALGHFLVETLGCVRLLFCKDSLAKSEDFSPLFSHGKKLKELGNADSVVGYFTNPDYVLSGYSPPPEYLPPSNSLNHTPYNTSFQPITMQIMSQLSILSPQTKPRMLGMRFDECT